MESVERVGEYTYGTTEKPTYAIITYTWGRFEAPAGSPALPVKGTTWAIPPVKPDEAFTVESFQAVVDYIGKKYDWLWLDVACIDQVNEDVKMSEVARQTGIFHGASEAYAWLHGLPSSASDHLTFLGSVAFYNPIQKEYSSDESDNEFEERDRLTLEHYIRNLSSIEASFRSIFRDPWFTSLWTLQESILRRDANFLCKYGSPLGFADSEESPPFRAYTINSLNQSCSMITADLQKYIHDQRLPPGPKATAETIIALIDKAGIRFKDAMNPNVQYGAAGFRETKYPLDRIYGIIGIYRTILPATFQLPDPKAVTLRDLETAFALALNTASPWLAQCFVHLDIPVERRSWCISQASSVPRAFQDIHSHLSMRTLGRITSTSTTTNSANTATANGCMLATGHALPLTILYTYWTRMRHTGAIFLTTRLPFVFAIAYDAYISELWPACLPQAPVGPIVEQINPQRQEGEHTFPVTEYLVQTYDPQDLKVLMLGVQDGADYFGTGRDTRAVDKALRIYSVPRTQKDSLDEIVLDDEDSETTWGLCWEEAGVLQKISFGVVLLREGGRWRRVGICTWKDNFEGGHVLPQWSCEIS